MELLVQAACLGGCYKWANWAALLVYSAGVCDGVFDSDILVSTPGGGAQELVVLINSSTHPIVFLADTVTGPAYDLSADYNYGDKILDL